MATEHGGEPVRLAKVDIGTDAPVGAPQDARPVRRPRHAHRARGAVIVAVGCGGVVGALARYALSLAMPTVNGQFPWGTFVVNASGSAVLGFLLVLLVAQFPRGQLARPIIATGVIGAYTTFSTYVVEAVLLVRAGHVGTAAIYVVGSVVAGLLAVWAGMMAARLLVRAERWLQEELA